MTESLTLDQVPFRADVSWIEDIQIPSSYREATADMTTHMEVISLIKKKSHLEKLFALNETLDTFASFTAPEAFYQQSNRFFYKTLFPSLDIHEVLERFELLDASMHLEEETLQIEKENLHGFLKELEFLSAILEEIYTKMLQYKKG